MKLQAKRFLSLLLCLSVLGVPLASAAPAEQSMAKGAAEQTAKHSPERIAAYVNRAGSTPALYADEFSTENSSWRSLNFTVSDAAEHVQVRFRNDTDRTCTVLLVPVSGGETAEPIRVDGGSEGTGTFPTAPQGTYYVLIEALQQGGSIAGALTVV